MRTTTLLTAAIALLTATANAHGGEAKFAYATYTGCDDYYEQCPLPTPDSFYNPILSGWHSDPSVCRAGDDYFMVSSTFGYFPGVPIFHSTDLVNWRQIGNVLNRPSQLPYLQGQDMGKGGVYAATIRYNPHERLFYMITTDVGATPYPGGRGAGGMEKGSHFYVTTADPFSNQWSDPVWLPDIGGIDPDLFFDDDGSAYIMHKEDVAGQPKWNNHRALRITRLDTKTGRTFGPDMEFREEGVGSEERLDRDEGPHLYKINGKYYVVCAEGGTGQNHSAVVYRADSPLGLYTRWSRNPMLTQRGAKGRYPTAVTCTGHADMVEDGTGRWWAVFLGCRPGKNGVEQLGRETFILPVKWSADGFPYLTQSQDTIDLTPRREGAVRRPTTLSGNFTWRDDFSSPAMRPEWITPWGLSQDYIKLRGGQLRLTPSATLPADRKPMAYIGRLLQHHKFTFETEMEYKPAEGEIAGIAVMRNETHNYIFGLRMPSGGEPETALLKDGKSGYSTIAAKPVHTATARSGRIWLKAVCHGDTYDFLFSTDGATWTATATDVPADYTSQKTGGFIGTTIGMCAFKADGKR